MHEENTLNNSRPSLQMQQQKMRYKLNLLKLSESLQRFNLFMVLRHMMHQDFSIFLQKWLAQKENDTDKGERRDRGRQKRLGEEV